MKDVTFTLTPHQTPVAPSRWGAHLDKVGMGASFACAVHCALMPLAITLLPFVGLGFLADERVEWLLVTLSAFMGVSSLRLGYRSHRRRHVFAVLSIGLAMLALGRVLEAHHLGGAWGVVIVVLGGITVALSHVLNHRLCQTCSCSCHVE